MPTIDLEEVDAILFDLDGVVTRTAALHAAAWKRVFDDFLASRARAAGAAFEPFDLDRDYRAYVDGKPRAAGVASFFAARGVAMPWGSPADGPEAETIHGLGNRKDHYFLELIDRQGVEVLEPTVAFIHEARSRGERTAIVSSSRNCAAILGAAGLIALFDTRVDGVDLGRLGLRGKPAPDMFFDAARRLAVEPRRAVVVEDALAGVEAGRRGGFRLIIGIGRGNHADALRRSGADLVVADLGELRLEGRARGTRAA